MAELQDLVGYAPVQLLGAAARRSPLDGAARLERKARRASGEVPVVQRMLQAHPCLIEVPCMNGRVRGAEALAKALIGLSASRGLRRRQAGRLPLGHRPRRGVREPYPLGRMRTNGHGPVNAGGADSPARRPVVQEPVDAPAPSAGGRGGLPRQRVVPTMLLVQRLQRVAFEDGVQAPGEDGGDVRSLLG